MFFRVVPALSFAAGLILNKTARPFSHCLPVLAAGLLLSLAPVAFASTIVPDPNNGGGVGGDAASAPGPGYSWVGTVDNVNTSTGNKLIEIPTVSWVARGGLMVDLTLYHNSQETLTSPSRGQKWSLIYDSELKADASGNVRVGWGNGRVYTFGNSGTTYSAPPGVHDTLIANGSPPTSYDLIQKDQTKWHFAPYGTGGYFYLTGISDENGNVITVNRAANGGMLGITDPTNRKVTFGFSSTYYTSITDPLGRVFNFGFDGSGNMSSVSYPVINGATYSINLGYNGNHDVTSIQDMRGNTATFYYNSDDSLAWEKDNLGNQTSFSYNAYSSFTHTSWTIITDPNGHTTRQDYDLNGRLAQLTDALNNVEYRYYTADNQMRQRVDRRGFQWNYTYDGMGNVLSVADPYNNGPTYTYNAHNKPLTIKTQMGRSVAAAYNAYDNLTQVQEKDAGGTVLATTTFAVNTSNGLVTGRTDPNGHTTTYGYDANGCLNVVITPLGRQTRWAYDALGFQTSRTDAMGRTTAYTPDAWERNVTTAYPDGSARTYAYDADGNLTGFTNALVATTRSYDADNRCLKESCNGTPILSHAYDAPGQKGLLSTTTDYLGSVHSFTYTARDQISTAGLPGQTASYGYDPDGNQTGAVNPNGTQVIQAFDNADQLTGVTNENSGGGLLFSFGYAYNADNQRTHSTEADGSAVTWGYDGQGHLSSEVRTGAGAYNLHYAYDGAGNRVGESGSYLNGTFGYDADDEMTGFTFSGTTYAAASFGYDADGERTSEVTGQYPGFGGYGTQFGYDFEGNLTSLAASGSSPVSYVYDGLDRQLGWQSGGSRLDYQLDGGAILTETNPTSSRVNLYGNGLVSSGGETLLYDGLGAVRQTTDGGQNVVWSSAYQSFGLGVASQGSTGSRYQWGAGSGYRSDGFAPADAAPLLKVGARYYDAQFGVFLTRDTELSQKPYAYCNGDPVNFVDPSGNWPTRRFWYWAGVTVIVGAEVAGGIISSASGPAGPVLAGAVVVGTLSWAYGGDPGGPFFTGTGHPAPGRPAGGNKPGGNRPKPVRVGDGPDPIRRAGGAYGGGFTSVSYYPTSTQVSAPPQRY